MEIINEIIKVLVGNVEIVLCVLTVFSLIVLSGVWKLGQDFKKHISKIDNDYGNQGYPRSQLEKNHEP